MFEVGVFDTDDAHVLERLVCFLPLEAHDNVDARRNFEKFKAIAARFLDVELSYAGHVPFSAAMRRSIVQRKPLLAEANNTPDKELLAFKALAQAVLKAPMNTYEGIRFFADKDSEQETMG